MVHTRALVNCAAGCSWLSSRRMVLLLAGSAAAYGSRGPSGEAPAAASSDLAIGGPTNCSGVQNNDPGLACSMGADGDLTTRWCGDRPSTAGSPQTWQVDLGKLQTVGSVRISWELAYARSYSLESSATGQQWSPFYTTTEGTGLVDTINNLSAHGRFVRIVLAAGRPNTTWGFSFYELEVFASTVAPAEKFPWHPPKPRSANPPWKPTWNMSMSTIIFPCNHSGFFSAEQAAQYGLVSIDFENTMDDWAFAKPTDQESRSLRQAEMIKAINPDTKVLVYRNLAKAEAMQASVLDKLEDPRFAGFFLKFAKTAPFRNGSYHVTKCGAGKNSTICSDFYHDLIDTPLPGPTTENHSYVKPSDRYYEICDGDVSAVCPTDCICPAPSLGAATQTWRADVATVRLWQPSVR